MIEPAKSLRAVRRRTAPDLAPLAACALLSLAPAHAQTPPPSSEANQTLLEQYQEAARDAATSTGPAALDRLIHTRSALLQSLPDDDRAAGWNADQAADLLDRLATDASDLFALMGVADDVQAARVRDRAARALAHLDRADSLAVLLREQERAAAARADSARAAALADALRPVDAGMRTAFLRAHACLLAAACENDPPLRARLATTAGAILAGLESANPLTQALRCFHLGSAKGVLEREDAAVLADDTISHDDWSAADLIRDVPPATELLNQAIRLAASSPRSDANGPAAGKPLRDESRRARASADAPPSDIGALIAGEARIGLVACARTDKELDEALTALRAALANPPFIRGRAREAGDSGAGAMDGALLVVAAETAARRTIARPAATDTDRVARVREACAWHADVLARVAASTGVADGQAVAVRAAIIRRLGALLGDDAPVESLPAAAGLALGVRWAASATPALHARAEGVFRATAARADAGDVGTLALRELGVVLTQSTGNENQVSRWIEGALALLDYADRLTDAGETGGTEARAESILAAAAAADRALASTIAQPAETAAARGTLIRALRAGIALGPNAGDIDQLRCRLVEVRLDSLGSNSSPPPTGAAGSAGADAESNRDSPSAERIGPEELDDLLGVLSGVGGASRWRAAADRLGVTAAVRALDAARDEPIPTRVRTARSSATWAASRNLPQADRLRLEWGEALLDAQDPGALRIFSDLAASLHDADTSTGPDASATGNQTAPRTRLPARRVLVGLGAAQRLAGQDEAAFTTWKGLVERIEAEAGSADRGAPTPEGAPPRTRETVRGREFWRAWAGMLEILASRNDDGSRSGQVRLWIVRLELIDPALGGGPEADRIRAVANNTREDRAPENFDEK